LSSNGLCRQRPRWDLLSGRGASCSRCGRSCRLSSGNSSTSKLAQSCCASRKTIPHPHTATAAIVTRTLTGIEDLPIIPREIEDILSIKTAERHRWLKDGRLQSAGTRTVKLRGRARKITFHVFEPRHIEDILDRNLQDIWREEDALVAGENRRRGRQKAAMKRAGKLADNAKAEGSAGREKTPLKDWDDFDLDGLLR
jgi:hypothetical protein